MRAVAVVCALLPFILVYPSPEVQPVSTILRHFDPGDRESGRYQYRALQRRRRRRSADDQLSIQWRRWDERGRSGLFEPGSLEIGTAAFRGYSGGARSGQSRLAAARRRQGIEPGRFQPGGGTCCLACPGWRRAAWTSRSTSPNRPSREQWRRLVTRPSRTPAAPASQPERRWYRGALHLHTTHSDGALTPAALAATAREAGFDFVAITDHNNTTHRARRCLTAAADRRGGSDDAERPRQRVGTRRRASGSTSASAGRSGAEATIATSSRAQSHRFGALFSINHPPSASAAGWTHEIRRTSSHRGLERPQETEGSAIALWDRLLRRAVESRPSAPATGIAAPNPIECRERVVYARPHRERDSRRHPPGRVIVMARDARHLAAAAGARAVATDGVGDSLAFRTAPTTPIQVDSRRDSPDADRSRQQRRAAHRGRIANAGHPERPDPATAIQSRRRTAAGRPSPTRFCRGPR